MGMYDTINGEQVKCFPWVHYYRDNIIKTIVTYSGGDLKYYRNKSKVPYKKFYYNYSKNFMILDAQEFFYKNYEMTVENEEETYNYILHIIRNGKVKVTYEGNKYSINEEDFSLNTCVIDYYGEFLNIKNSNDIIEYMKGKQQYHIEYEKINKKWNELFKESMKYFSGIALLDPDSEEKKERLEKIKEIHKQMEEEKKRIKDDIDILAKTFRTKWIIENEELNDIISLGEFLSCLDCVIKRENMNNREEARIISSNFIVKKLEENEDLYKRYIEWYCENDLEKEEIDSLILFAKNNYNFNYEIKEK